MVGPPVLPRVRDPRTATANRPRPYRTLFLQELLRHGVLGQSFVVSAAHTDEDLQLTVDAVRRALPVYRRALERGDATGLFHGRPVAPALREASAPRITCSRHLWSTPRKEHRES